MSPAKPHASIRDDSDKHTFGVVFWGTGESIGLTARAETEPTSSILKSRLVGVL